MLFIPLSFLVPIFDIGFNTVLNGEIKIPEFVEFAPTSQALVNVDAVSPAPLNISKYIWFLYWTGFAFFVSRFGLSAYRLIHLKRKSQCWSEGGYHFISANVSTIFSCFNYIFLPKTKTDGYEKSIIEHEKAHANFWHTLDLILTEICIALLWFNPFVFFFRKSLKSVHEFQADEFVLRGNVPKSHYLKLMYNTLETNEYVGVYSYFNRLTIKNRVIMISTNKSRKTQIINYFLILPVIAVLAMAFSKPTGSPPSMFPIKAGEYHKITQTFNKEFINPITNKKTVHGGIDITADEGVNVLATGGGTITSVKDDEGWGKLIIVDHGEGYETWYAHLQDFNVKEGKQVTKGETIGFVGNTGYSTGPHLHYEVRLNGERVDPMDYMGEERNN